VHLVVQAGDVLLTIPKTPMPRSQTISDSIIKLLDQSARPIYLVDGQRRITYCNAALAAWIDLDSKRIVGRRVEFHSEGPKTDEANRDTAPITDLCPPPQSFSGEVGKGTVSCQARDGHIIHRAAEFIPLGRTAKAATKVSANGVLVLLQTEDLSPQEVAAHISGEPTTDELHRTIRRFRRGQVQRYSLHSLLGSSSAMKKVRSQVEAAAASGAHTLIRGRRGSGRSHLALAIHYYSARADENRLIPLDCELLTDEMLGDTLEKLRPTRVATELRPTLMLENLEFLMPAQQRQLLGALQKAKIKARIVATGCLSDGQLEKLSADDSAGERSDMARLPSPIDAALVDALSTITIHVPRLVDRLDDLPVLAQYFLEACNRGNSKQVGSLRPDALDALALYSWPGELDQLRETIEAAHAACDSHEISAASLPPTFYHAFRAAKHVRLRPEPIVLDELLAAIEKEAIVRALAQANGNKSEAATLLGMTRPRLYRRLVQLGLAGEEVSVEVEFEEAPEFVEHDPAE
jgi:DNA-binding NtrC family response regulator